MVKTELESIKLLVVIINYFSANLVGKLVAQLAYQPSPDQVHISIICADNSADADQQQALASICSSSNLDVELIRNHDNRGFGAAINDSVRGKAFDFLCCINPDVSLFPKTLFELLTHGMEHRAEGLWGGLTVDDKLKPDFRHAWQEPTLKNTSAWAFGLHRFIQSATWQDGYQHLKEHTSLPYPVDSVSGCFLLISVEAWQATNGFDPDFFLYSEEVDLCRRARSMGFQPTVVPRSTLQHDSHSVEESSNRVETIYSAKLLYSSKHHGQLYNVLYRGIIFIGAMIRAIASTFKGKLRLSTVWCRIALSSLRPKPAGNSSR